MKTGPWSHSPYFINDWTVYEAECQRLQAGLQQRMEGYTPGMMPSFEEVLEELPKVVQDIDVSRAQQQV